MVAVAAVVGASLSLGGSSSASRMLPEPVPSGAGQANVTPDLGASDQSSAGRQRTSTQPGANDSASVAATSAGTKKGRSGGPSHKLSSGLAILAARPNRPVGSAKTAAAVGVPVDGPGSLMTRPGNSVLATVGGITGSEQVAAVAGTGTRIVNQSFGYGLATVAVAPSQLLPVARIPGVTAIREVLQPRVAAVGAAVRASGGVCAPVKSEADSQLKNALAKSQFGVDGTGATVGILSDSFGLTSSPTSVAQDIASGNLPGPGNPCGRTTAVQVLEEYDPDPGSHGIDEGRAMVQLVHHAAPGAQIKFATAFNGELGFANNIRALADAGAKIIVDDVAYLDEPMYQDGIVAQAINDVTADGVIYLTSAGNDNVILGGNNVASVEVASPASGTACPAVVSISAGQQVDCVEFSGSDVGAQYTVAKNKSISANLQWNQPWNGVTTDYDLYILNQSGNKILASSEYNSPVEGVPFEYADWLNGTAGAAQVQVVIARFSGPNTRLKYVVSASTNALTAAEYSTSGGGLVVGPTIYGHAGSRSATTVAAARFDNDSQAETFSSRGPVTHYFGPVVGSSAATGLGSADVISKPDIAGTDGDCTTFFYANQVVDPPTCPYRFFGTSAAAPNVGAAAALLSDANPALTGAQLRTLVTDNAAAMAGGVNVVGTGLTDTRAAIAAASRVPRGPARPSALADIASAVVSFNPPAVTGSTTIDDYRATCKSAGHTTGTATGTASPLVVPGLDVGRSYTCTVQARNSVGFGPSSAASVPVTPFSVLVVPDDPTGVSGKRGNAAVRVSWQSPVPNGGPAITSYRATATPGGRTCTTGGSARSCTVTGLANGTNYTFTVIASNSVGPSAPSSASAGVRPATSPSKPRALKARYIKARAKVRWRSPASNGGLPVTSYRYRVSKNNGKSWTSWRSTGKSKTRVVKRKRKLVYRIQVRAMNPAGLGSTKTLKLRKYR